MAFLYKKNSIKQFISYLHNTDSLLKTTAAIRHKNAAHDTTGARFQAQKLQCSIC